MQIFINRIFTSGTRISIFSGGGVRKRGGGESVDAPNKTITLKMRTLQIKQKPLMVQLAVRNKEYIEFDVCPRAKIVFHYL